jgi:uncharacterized phage-associated protein
MLTKLCATTIYLTCSGRSSAHEIMAVEFKFDFPRTLAAITYIASKNVPDLTMYKMLKLLFLADKHHLVQYGRTITGDKYAALKDGPVPSRTYDFFKKQVLKKPFSEEGRRILANLDVDKRPKHPRFKAIKQFDANQLSQSDLMALDKAISDFGHFSYGQLRQLTHDMAAFEKAWKNKKIFSFSVPMKIEDFFEDDPDALPAAKEEMIENDQIRKVLA